MAKPLAEVLAFPTKQAEVVPFPIVACGCKRSTCIKINIERDEWIYSGSQKQYYGDLQCLAHGTDAYYDHERKAVFFNGWMTVEGFLKEMQATSNINYLPIA